MHLPANVSSARRETLLGGGAYGLSLTASGSINTKGAWANLGTAGFNYEGVTINLLNNGTAIANYLVDIGIDAGGDTVNVVIENLELACRDLQEHTFSMFIPVHIPAGAVIDARCQSNVASAVVTCTLVGHSANPGGFPGYRKASALFTPTSSRGTTITAGGTINTKGSWSVLRASLDDAVDMLFGVSGFAGDTARTNAGTFLMDISIGADTVEEIVIADQLFQFGVLWDGPLDIRWGPYPVALPAGVRIAARCQSTNNTSGDNAFDLALYGLSR